MYFIFNPIMLRLVLVIFAILIAFLYHFLFSKWIMFVIMLVFLGGIIIIFIYIASLAGNSKIFFFTNLWPIIIIFFTLMFFFNITYNPFWNIKSQFHLYSFMSFQILWFVIIYLLASLFCIVKITENFKGPLIHLF